MSLSVSQLKKAKNILVCKSNINQNLISKNFIFDSGSGYYSKALINKKLSGFSFYEKNQVSCLVSLPVIVSLLIEPDILSSPIPYKPGRLVIPAPDAIDQRWCIKYYVFDAQQGKVVRKRDFKCNEIKDLTKRKAWCNRFIKELNKKLEEGFHIDAKKLEQQQLQKRIKNKEFISIADACALALKSKKNLRPKTLKNYNDYLNGWFKSINPKLHITTVTEKSIKPFLIELEDRVSQRTFNNYVQHISTIFNFIVKEGILEENPWTKVEARKTLIGKNIAYSKTDQKRLMEFMEHNYPEMKLYCSVIYYTLARPNEISHIQIKHLEMYRPKHLFIPGEISKNGRDRHVTLPPAIYEQLEPLLKLNKEWFLFGKGLKPGPEFLNPRYVSDSYRNRVLKKLEFGSDHTLYSWKHTGVVNNYLAGLSPASLRMQIGHADTGSFEKYLKSLGLFENKEVMENYVSI